MLLAIESFVQLFERLILERPVRRSRPGCAADNDNSDLDDEDRRWAAYR